MLPTRRLGLFVVALLLLSFAPSVQAQAPTAPGVEIDCDEKQENVGVSCVCSIYIKMLPLTMREIPINFFPKSAKN